MYNPVDSQVLFLGACTHCTGSLSSHLKHLETHDLLVLCIVQKDKSIRLTAFSLLHRSAWIIVLEVTEGHNKLNPPSNIVTCLRPAASYILAYPFLTQGFSTVHVTHRNLGRAQHAQPSQLVSQRQKPIGLFNGMEEKVVAA